MVHYTGILISIGVVVQSKFSLTEGSIPRALLAFSLPAVMPPLASLTSLAMALGYYRFGGWRNVRLGIAEAVAAPTA
jgi:hypothetical protein